jgi:CheY-like chemotaxis protein
MTAFAMDGDREEFLEKGCDDYIAKPFYRDELKSLIRKYISV